jgi:hypothetical protein
MCVLSRSLSILFCFVVVFPLSTCKCRQSYMTICDNYEDIINYDKADDFSDLVVGSSEVKKKELISIDLFALTALENLKILVIIGQADRLRPKYDGSVYTKKLNFISLYGNNLRQIHKGHLPTLHVRKLSLVNNNIEMIEGGAFEEHSIEDLDFSDNLLESIDGKVLSSMKETKVITIRNNQLSYIEIDSFPSGLKVLNLDQNKLEYIQEHVFENLKNLERLTLSYNKLVIIPNISYLKRLHILDLSVNSIVTVAPNDLFDSLTELQSVDLSHNKIKDPRIIHRFVFGDTRPYLRVSLAFNHLRTLHVAKRIYLQEKTFILYGNPWDCAEIKVVEKVLICHESRCGLEFYSSGKTPVCINYSWKRKVDLSNYTEEREIHRFQDSIKTNAELIDCDLLENLPKQKRVAPRIPLCDDSKEIDFRVSLLQDRIDNILD